MWILHFEFGSPHYKIRSDGHRRKTKGGLEDVVATSSAICYLDGDRGVLAYCGYDIHDLAQSATFEEVCYLLWHRRLPTRAELGDLQSQLAAARPLPEPIIRLMRSLPPVNGMDALRTVTSALAHYDADADDASPQAQYRKAVRLTAQVGTDRRDVGTPAGRRRSDRAGPGDGSRRELPLHAHRRAARTRRRFAPSTSRSRCTPTTSSMRRRLPARVAAATLTDIYSAVVAAIGTLKGPLHGGANAEVMKMLLELGQTATGDRVDDFIRGKLARKEKIPGFGHRVYKTEDPRATHLRQMSRDLGKRAGSTAWFDISQRIEALVKGEKKLNPNVDFYSASTYYTLGIPIDLYTPIFAVSRMSGWTAHILEQYANNRLIRPRADYTGPSYPQRFVPLEQR